MIALGIPIEREHHEVATAGQAEIDIVFDTLLRTSDKMCLYKYICRNVAYKHGKTVTFMPKPLFGDNGSGMHTHQSLWKDGKPLFAGNGYAGLSEMALYYIGGILEARAGPVRHLQSDEQLLQAAGPRLRGAGQPRLLRPQPLGLDPHPDLQPEPEGQAHRVPHAGSGGQSVPGQRRHAHGRPRRHPEQDPSRRAARQEPLRPPAGGEGQGAAPCPIPSRARSRRSRRTTPSCSRAACSTQDFLDNYIEMKRGEYDAVRLRPHPVRVPPLLRRLIAGRSHRAGLPAFSLQTGCRQAAGFFVAARFSRPSSRPAAAASPPSSGRERARPGRRSPPAGCAG